MAAEQSAKGWYVSRDTRIARVEGGFYATVESRHGEEGFPAIRALHL